jgi:uncharacterized membrane protein YdjX (TVP38/TMEM64 family)
LTAVPIGAAKAYFPGSLASVSRGNAPSSLGCLMLSKEPLKDLPGCPARLTATPKPAAGAAGKRRSLLRLLRRFGPLVLIAALMVLVFAMGWHRQVTLANIVRFRDEFHHVIAEHQVLSIISYIVLYILAASLSLPGCGLFTAAGGLMFGWLIGGLATVVGATIGATILFLIARTAVSGLLTEETAPWLSKLRTGFQQDALSYLLFLRLVPAFPFWFVNVAPAVLGVPLRTYVIGTFLGIIPATFAFASAGAGLDSVIMAAKSEYAACLARGGAKTCKLMIHASSLVTKELILALLLLGVVALIPVAFRKWRTVNAAAK